MDGFSLTTTTTTAALLSINPSLFSPFSLIRRRRRKPPPSRNINFLPNPKFIVLASNSNDDAAPKLNRWEQMELKFGNMLGEDPKLTLAKIMGKKLNPDASYLDIEKSFHKNKGKIVHIEELPFDGSKKQQSSDSKVQPSNRMNLVRPVPIKSQSSNSLNGLNLVRPVPKKGVRFEANDNSNSLEVKKPNQSVRMKPLENTKGSIPNVILRKPTLYKEDDVDTETSKLRIKSNLSLRMRNEQGKENFSHMTLLRKPEQITATPNPDKNVEASGNAEAEYVDDFELIMRKESQDTPSAVTLLKKPEAIGISTNLDEKQETSEYAEEVLLDENKESSLCDIFVSGEEIANATTNSYEKSLESGDGSFSTEAKLEDDSTKGLEPLKQTNMGFTEKGASVSSDTYMIDSSDNFFIEAALQGKPKRLHQPVKEASNSIRADAELDNLESYGNVDLESFLGTLPLKKPEDTDWTRAEELVRTGERDDVELISCSTRGFVVSFGALIGFLPYRNLAAKWKFLAFESWLRRKGLDPSMYRQSLGIIGSYDGANKNTSHDSIANPEIDRKIGELSQDMKLEELLRIYDKEKIKFLSSFVGQRIKVNVLMADRKSRQLIFSIRPKEKEELVEKKRTLMAKLSIGDVVKCCIRKITYFGIFVEVEGVPALIHQTEVSWDATLDPASYYKIGQIVEAKVHQLDFALERIFLSLKEITPDPLIEALESVVGDRNSLDGKLEAAQPDREWADVESLVKELQQIEGIQSVSKGRYFLSPGLAPTFQVYMASMFENQYKLLARSENKVQEVIVQTSLDKEEMKSAILTCTSRVE